MINLERAMALAKAARALDCPSGNPDEFDTAAADWFCQFADEALAEIRTLRAVNADLLAAYGNVGGGASLPAELRNCAALLNDCGVAGFIKANWLLAKANAIENAIARAAGGQT